MLKMLAIMVMLITPCNAGIVLGTADNAMIMIPEIATEDDANRFAKLIQGNRAMIDEVKSRKATLEARYESFSMDTSLVDDDVIIDIQIQDDLRKQIQLYQIIIDQAMVGSSVYSGCRVIKTN